jgi:lysophospholipase L1-like esterase
MTATNKVYIFFIAVALCFWNPLSFYALYGDSPIYAMRLIQALFIGSLALGLFVIYLLRRNRLSQRLSNWLLSFAFIGIFLAFLIGLDKLIGWVKPPKKEEAGLIYPPLSIAHYRTTEFDFTADINSLGLREREIKTAKDTSYRILCFGDSWTYGWGVAEEQAWPRRLEAYLKAQGRTHVEVVNCGQSGQYSYRYRQLIERIVPLLKPDLVLVGVLQGDDLAQVYENKFNPSVNDPHMTIPQPKSLRQSLKIAVKSFLQYSFKNTLALFRPAKPPVVDIHAEWLPSVQNKIKSFSLLQRLRFESFPDTVRHLFETGNLNPGLLDHYLDFPDRYWLFNTPENQATQYAAEQMKKDFAAMRQTCDGHKAKLVFVNLPFNFYVGHRVIRTAMDKLNPFLERENKIDSIYHSVAATNGLDYIELTAGFRNLSDKTGYFFKYDGHPNARGYDEIGKQIAQMLLAKGLP